MSNFAYGFWGTVDQSLQRIGRTAACVVSPRGRSAEDVACAVLGGSVLCATGGALVGFALSDLSRSMATFQGAIVGLLLGACVGVFFGSFVETIDEYIQSVLKSLRIR